MTTPTAPGRVRYSQRRNALLDPPPATTTGPRPGYFLRASMATTIAKVRA